MVAPLPLPPSRQEELQELFGDKNPYPAEDRFDPPTREQLQKTYCSGTYGLLVGHSFVKLECALNAHQAPVFHAAPLADGVFRWPFSAKGVEDSK